MLRRLFLMVLLWTTLVLPVVVRAENDGPPPENPEIKILNDESRCNFETLGVYGGGEPVELRATWRPKVYNCDPGEYLKKTSETVECVICPINSYCPGVVDYTYADSDFGIKSCPDGYIIEVEGNSLERNCYKKETLLCSELSPFNAIEHATMAEYNTEEINCVQHAGENKVCDSSCMITNLYCESGYLPMYESGVWSCVGTSVVCSAGTYLPMESTECVSCPENHFCSGGTYPLSESQGDDKHDQGIEKCEDNLKAPMGSKSEKDCGKILRVGGDALYLYSDDNSERKGDNPRFVVRDKDGTWYANMTPISEGVKKVNSESETRKELHIKIGKVEYTVHTTISDSE